MPNTEKFASSREASVKAVIKRPESPNEPPDTSRLDALTEALERNSRTLWEMKKKVYEGNDLVQSYSSGTSSTFSSGSIDRVTGTPESHGKSQKIITDGSKSLKRKRSKSPKPVPASQDALPWDDAVEYSHSDKWHDNYVRTRHKNIRCFPYCSTIHKERSFCGQTLTVYYPCEDLAKATELVFLGCFRRVKENLLFRKGQNTALTDDDTYANAIISGVFVSYDERTKMAAYEFRPPRKWRYMCEQNKYTTSEKHAFTSYLCEKDDDGNIICKAYKDSPHFSIISAWKQSLDTVSRPMEEDGESLTSEEDEISGSKQADIIGATQNAPEATVSPRFRHTEYEYINYPPPRGFPPRPPELYHQYTQPYDHNRFREPHYESGRHYPYFDRYRYPPPPYPRPHPDPRYPNPYTDTRGPPYYPPAQRYYPSNNGIRPQLTERNSQGREQFVGDRNKESQRVISEATPVNREPDHYYEPQGKNAGPQGYYGSYGPAPYYQGGVPSYPPKYPPPYGPPGYPPRPPEYGRWNEY